MATSPLTVNYIAASNAAVVVNAATSDEMFIRGLQSMGLCLGFTKDTEEVLEMGRRIAIVRPTGGTFEASSVEYNFLTSDKSLELFRNSAINDVLLQNIRLYLKVGCDFSAPDLISDPASGLSVGTVGDPKADSPNAIFKGELEYMPAGAFCLFVAHTGNGNGTDLSYVASTRTLSTTGTSFVDLGFEVGDTLYIDYADSNDPLTLKLETVTATDIVFESGEGDVADLATDFSGVDDTQLHGATPMQISGYSDATTC